MASTIPRFNRPPSSKKLNTTYELCQSDTQSLCDEVDDNLINPSTQMPYPEAQGLQTGNPGFPGYAVLVLLYRQEWRYHGAFK